MGSGKRRVVNDWLWNFRGENGEEGSKSKTFNVDGDTVSDGITVIDADTVAVALDTGELDTGDLYLKATVTVPDTDFPTGSRKEIVHHNLHRSIV